MIRGQRTGRTAAVVSGSGSLLLLAATTCPTVYFGDSGELIAAAAVSGVAHPPGYPLYTRLAALALAVPWGEPAWRVNLLSALLGAACCALVAWLVARWTRNTPAAVAAGLCLAVSATFWRAATTAEVYTLHLLLLVGLLACASRLGDGAPRALPALGALVGLGLAHRPTVLLALPAAALLTLRRPSAMPRARATPVLMGLTLALALGLPLLGYLDLWLRAGASPPVHWGAPFDAWGLWRHVSTQAYGHYRLGLDGWLRPEGWHGALELVWSDLAGVGVALALAGWWMHARVPAAEGVESGARVVAAQLWLALAWLGFGLSYGIGDVEVLYLPLVLAVALGAGLGVHHVSRRAGDRATAVACLLGLLLVAAPAWRHLPSRNLRGVTAAADHARDLLDTVPTGGALFVEGDETFLLAYRVLVLGERPDVRILDRNGQLFDDLRREASAPNVAAQRSRIEREIAFAVQAVTRGDAVLFMTWPGYELPGGLRFEPDGVLYRVLPSQQPPLPQAARWSRYHERSIRAQSLRLADPFARSVAAIYPLMRGERARFEGRWEEAIHAFDEAADLAGPSEAIHNYLGTIWGRAGELERASAAFRQALAARPVSLRAWNNLAQARWLLGDAAGARAAWRRSLELDADQPGIRRRLVAATDR